MADEAKETARVEAFSDGVFAIAMTLLVLELRLPVALTKDLWHSLVDLAPKYLAFALSFTTILIMWVNHHGLFRKIRRVDAHLLFTNGLLLLFVTFVPFPTSVLGDQLRSTTGTDAKVAAGLYALMFVAINAAWALMWQSVAHRRHAVAPGIADHEAHTISVSLLVGFLAYACAVGLAFVNAWASVGLCMLLAIFWTFEAFRHHPEAAA